MILAADAVALFPSLDPKKTAELVGREFVTSNLEMDGVDYLELGKYIALNWTPAQIKLAGLASEDKNIWP